MKKTKHIYQFIADNRETTETKKLQQVTQFNVNSLVFLIEVVSSEPLEFISEKQCNNA